MEAVSYYITMDDTPKIGFLLHSLNIFCATMRIYEGGARRGFGCEVMLRQLLIKKKVVNIVLFDTFDFCLALEYLKQIFNNDTEKKHEEEFPKNFFLPFRSSYSTIHLYSHRQCYFEDSMLSFWFSMFSCSSFSDL